MHRWAIAVAVSVGLGASASPAFASYVDYQSEAPTPGTDFIGYSADDYDLAPGLDNGAANRVTVTSSTDGHTVTIRDAGQLLRPAFNTATRDRCTFTRDTAVCTVPPDRTVSHVSVVLGAGNDRATLALPGLPPTATTAVFGGPGNDRVVGSDLADDFTGGPGADEFLGGAGEDTFRYDDEGRTGGVDVTLDGKPGDGAPGENDYLHADVEDVFGSAGNDHLIGDDGPNVLIGFNGNDVIEGRGGDDDVSGWFGSNQIYGGDGNDQVTGGSGPDLLDGGTGSDRITGSRGDDTIRAVDGTPDTVDCSDGNDS